MPGVQPWAPSCPFPGPGLGKDPAGPLHSPPPSPSGGASPGQGRLHAAHPARPGPHAGCLLTHPNHLSAPGSSWSPASRPDSQPARSPRGPRCHPCCVSVVAPASGTAGGHPPVYPRPLETSGMPFPTKARRPCQGRREAGRPGPGPGRRPGQRKSGDDLFPSVPRHRGEQRDGPAAGAHRSGALSPLRQQPMEPTYHCLEQLQEELLRDGLQTLTVKARALTQQRPVARGAGKYAADGCGS